MSLKTKIQDGQGSARLVGITQDHALKVSIIPNSSRDLNLNQITRNKILRGFFENEDGYQFLNVNGSIDTKIYNAKPGVNTVFYIYALRFIFNGSDMDISRGDEATKFGIAANSPGLTNGIIVQAIQGTIPTDIITRPVKNIAGFLDYSDEFVNLIDGVSNGVDYLSFDFNFEVPIILLPEVQDSISVFIRDDLSSINSFKILYRGYMEKF